MNEQEAFYSWVSEFDVPVYAEGSVPDKAALPYITFSWAQGVTFDEVGCVVTAYARTKSLKRLADVCEGIVEALSHGGVTLTCDTGLLWLNSGSPVMQFFTLEEGLAGCYINMNIQFMTL